MRTEEILKQIREQNQKNQRIQQQAAAAPQGMPDYVEAIDSVKERVAKEIRQRIDGVASEYRNKLQEFLANQERALSRHRNKLADTQAIGSVKKSESVDAESAVEAPDLDTLLDSKMIELEDRLVKALRGSGTLQTEFLREQLSQLETRIAASSGGDATDSNEPARATVEELEQALSSGFEDLKQHLIDASSAVTSSAAQPESGSSLDGLAADLEERVQQCISRETGRILEAVQSPGVDLQPIAERLDAIAARLGSGAGDSAPAESDDSSSELLSSVKGLRKEFSLLVHTINSNLEGTAAPAAGSAGSSSGSPGVSGAELESIVTRAVQSTLQEVQSAQSEQTQGLVDQITENVKEVLLGLGEMTGSADDLEEPLAQLRKALQDLDEVRALPEKLSGLLSASEEAQQFGVSSAVQEAADHIISRVEEIVSS